MQTRVGIPDFHWSGLAVSILGFAISRTTVASSVTMGETVPQFVLTTLVPMTLSFGLVVVGIALAVSSFRPAFVRTVSLWCLLGTAGMFLTVVVAAVDSGTLASMGGLFGPTAGSYATNAVLGGAVGGTLIGLYAARANRTTDRVEQQADRLHLLNRLLRDEVLNATTVVMGHAEILDESADPSTHADPIRRNADHIRAVVEDVGDLADGRADHERVLGPVDTAETVTAVVDGVRERSPEARITVDSLPSAPVLADDQFGTLLEQILSNAVEHNDSDAPRVSVSSVTRPHAVDVTVSDDGPGLGESERTLLEAGDLGRYDRPSEGFGLWIASLLLDRYDGAATVSVDDGTTVTLSVPRADTPGASQRREESTTVPPRTLGLATLSGVAAGVGMGLTLQTFSNTIPVIGALYGTASVGVGWISHLFHSVVFAVVFVTVLSHPRLARVRSDLVSTTLLAVGFGTALWLLAAGVVMPLWLQAVGLDVSVPRLRVVPLLGHLLWGGLVGAVYWGLAHSPVADA